MLLIIFTFGVIYSIGRNESPYAGYYNPSKFTNLWLKIHENVVITLIWKSVEMVTSNL